jgi:histone H3/H4
MSEKKMAIAPLKRIITRITVTGRKPQIGKPALELFRDEVERYANKLAEKAATQAATMGRTTIRSEDIHYAIKERIIIEEQGEEYETLGGDY